MEFLDELIRHDDYPDFDYGIPEIKNYSNTIENNDNNGTAYKDISGIEVTFSSNEIADTVTEIYNVKMHENTMPLFLGKAIKLTLV